MAGFPCNLVKAEKNGASYCELKVEISQKEYLCFQTENYYLDAKGPAVLLSKESVADLAAILIKFAFGPTAKITFDAPPSNGSTSDA